MAKEMKEYRLACDLYGHAYITVTARSAEEAMQSAKDCDIGDVEDYDWHLEGDWEVIDE